MTSHLELCFARSPDAIDHIGAFVAKFPPDDKRWQAWLCQLSGTLFSRYAIDCRWTWDLYRAFSDRQIEDSRDAAEALAIREMMASPEPLWD